MFFPSYYFSLQSSSHPCLFEEDFVWNILKNLPFYIKTQKLGKIDIKIPNGVHLENPELISIGEGTIIEPCVYIKGPALIGKKCIIRHGAYIRENVILENEVLIGHDTEVKNSILLYGSHAAHFNYVGDSILGSHTNLGAGVKCANIRLDMKEIVLKWKEEKAKTGLIKLGVILGDESQIGCNSVTNPGTLIGKKVFSPPGIVLKGSIFSGSKVHSKYIYGIKKETQADPKNLK